MELEWSDNSDNEFWVVIERCTGANCTDFVSVGTTRGENAVSYRDRTVAAGTTYTYRVKAVGSAGSSPYSNTAVGTTSVKTPPAAPSDLTAAVTGETITLKWSDNSSNELQFPIERCEGVGCSTFTQINAVDDNITEFVDYDAEPGRTYSYRVGPGIPAGIRAIRMWPPLAISLRHPSHQRNCKRPRCRARQSSCDGSTARPLRMVS